MTNVDKRIAVLEEELQALRAQLEQTKAAPTPLPPKVIERKVSVSRASQLNARFVMPGEDQLRRLFDVVTRKFPVLRAGISKGRFADQDERDLYREYRVAFEGLASVGRTPDGSMDEKRNVNYWEMLIHSRGGGLVGTLPFVAGVIAHNDISFRFNVDHMAESCCFGLREGGVLPTDKWRRVIETNSTRDSLPLPLNRNYGGFVKAPPAGV